MPTIFNIVLPASCVDLSVKQKNESPSNSEYKVQEINHLQIDKGTLVVDQSWHKAKYGFNLSKSEIDIFELHRLAWKQFVKSSDSYCAIIENYPVQFECSIPKLNFPTRSWDILFPFSKSNVMEVKDELEKIKIRNNNLHERKEYEPYLMGRKWGSFFYFISREGVEKLLKINKITQNVDDEILLLSHEDKLNVYCKDFHFFKYINRPQILNLEREKEIYGAIMANSVWKENTLKIAKKLLKLVADIAKDLNIKLLLEGGTLLGHIQHGGFMPWDDDIDVGIHHKDLDILLPILKERDDLKIKKITEEWSGTPFYKIWMENGTPIENAPYKFPFIDLWIYKITDKDIKYLNGIVYKDAVLDNFMAIDFEGADLYIPFNATQCLDERYKTWRKTIRVYQWSHQYETNCLYPLTVKIKTDQDGRMIAPLFQLLTK